MAVESRAGPQIRPWRRYLSLLSRVLALTFFALGIAQLVRYEIQPTQFGAWKMDRWTGATWACYAGANVHECVELQDIQRPSVTVNGLPDR